MLVDKRSQLRQFEKLKNKEVKTMSIFDAVMTIQEHAAMKQAEAQHSNGVTLRMNPITFKIEYVRPDGTLVPDYEHFFNLERK